MSMRPDYLRPAYAAMGTGSMPPVLQINIVKVDNGYAVDLAAMPRRKERSPESGFVSAQDPDEMIDKMVDGLGAFLRAVHDEGAGETWKDGGDREKVREAVKTFFPSAYRQAVEMSEPPAEPPRSEERVFETKESLLKYLTENL